MLAGPQISKHTYKFIKQCLTFQPTFPPTPQKGLVEKPIGKDSRTRSFFVFMCNLILRTTTIFTVSESQLLYLCHITIVKRISTIPTKTVRTENNATVLESKYRTGNFESFTRTARDLKQEAQFNTTFSNYWKRASVASEESKDQYTTTRKRCLNQIHQRLKENEMR